jgi:hypothetical protein
MADMQWICSRLSRLTTQQWRDAFRAGGYDAETAARYIRRLKEKISEGLAASGTAGAAAVGDRGVDVDGKAARKKELTKGIRTDERSSSRR